jgi:NADH dehydrogenase FAD-containing subunit
MRLRKRILYGDIASPIRWILRRQENLRVLLGEVEAIDTAARRVRLVDGAVIDYDYLIVASGASHASAAARLLPIWFGRGLTACWPGSPGSSFTY